MWPAVQRTAARVCRLQAACARRRLWVAAASADPSLGAAASQCVDTVRLAVARARASSGSAPHGQSSAGPPQDACFVLVSQAYAGSDIARLASGAAQQLREAGLIAHVSGTVVDQVLDGSGRSSARGLSMLYYHAGAERETDPPAPQRRLRVQPFYVGDQHGRQRLREVAVGRWHNDVTDRFEAHRARGRWIHGESSVTRAASHVELPPELAGGIGDSEAVRLVLFASDRESRQVLDALDARFPGATKLGIVGSQTPFLNGREYTLLADDQIHDSGVLGFAFAAQRCHLDQRRDIAGPPRVSYSGLEPISGALRIERCKGNVVLELEDGASIHLLVAALRGRRLAGGGAETDSQLFARIMRTRDMGAPCSDSAVPPPETGSMVLRVTGGNPAKGGLALDTLRDLAPGQYIQFLMPALDGHPRSASKSNGSTSADGVEVLFGACGSDGGSGQGSADPRPAGHCWPAGVAFGGATEGGFAYGRPRPHGSPAPEKDDGSVFSGSIECAVPGSTVALELK